MVRDAFLLMSCRMVRSSTVKVLRSQCTSSPNAMRCPPVARRSWPWRTSIVSRRQPLRPSAWPMMKEPLGPGLAEDFGRSDRPMNLAAKPTVAMYRLSRSGATAIRPRLGSSSQATKARDFRPFGKARTMTVLRQPHSQPSQKTSVARTRLLEELGGEERLQHPPRPYRNFIGVKEGVLRRMVCDPIEDGCKNFSALHHCRQAFLPTAVVRYHSPRAYAGSQCHSRRCAASRNWAN